MEQRPNPMATMMMCGAANAIGGGLAWSIVPALMPAIAKELSISQTMGGVVWGAAPLGIALCAPLGGAAVDRFGVRRVVTLALIFGAAACAARAFAVGPWSLALAMFAFGAHVGFCAPAIPKALAEHVAVQKLGRANGAAVLCYTLATAITILTAGTLLAPALGGWRPAMLLAAVAMLAVSALWWAVVRDRALTSRHASASDVIRLARDPQLRRVAGVHFLLFGGYLAMLGILPRTLIEAGVPATRVVAAIAGWLGAAALANFLGPWASDRFGVRRPFIVGGAIVAAAALAAMAALPPTSGVALLVVAALGGGCFAPLLLSLPLELPSVGPARAGAALGLLMLVGQAGGFLLPVLAGAAAQHGGLPLALSVLALAHLAILIPARGLQERSGADSAFVASDPLVA